MSFRQLTLVQCLYIIFFGDLNSQECVGTGWVNIDSYDTTTGDTNNYGFMSENMRASNLGIMLDQKHHIKCFGMEDLWGNYRYVIAGAGGLSNNLVIVPHASAQSSRDSDWSSKSNWTNYGNYHHGGGAPSGFLRIPIGDNNGGFLVGQAAGSSSTLYCDYSHFPTGSYMTAGGYRLESLSGGMFYIQNESADAGGHKAFRLAYYHKENS
jgi:hypothetical protein